MVPLDHDVATGLLDFSRNEGLQKWWSIKDLKREESIKFQEAAQQVGSKCGIARLHVDLLYWRS